MLLQKKRLLLIIIAAAVLLYGSMVFCSQNSDAATFAPRTTWTIHNGWKSYQTTASGFCTEYPHGILAGWIIEHDQYSSWPVQQQYRFGPWSGSYCSNGRRLWDVHWGGTPGGWANWAILWQFDSDKTHVADQDLTGTFRFRRWVTRMHTTTPILQRVDFPWLEVDISTSGNISQSHGCGC